MARYANRVVIANSRLQGIVGDDVLFDYKNYRDGNRWKTKQMPGVEFIERFLQHMLPSGFHNKRRYGFWGYRVRTKNLALIRGKMGVAPVVLDMLWEDMAAALDVWPNSYRVRTYEDVYLDGLKAILAEQAVGHSRVPRRLTARPEPRCVERACGIAIRFESV